MWAWLWRVYEGKFGRAEFIDLDERTLLNIFTRPSSRNPSKPYWPARMFDPEEPAPELKDVGIRGVYFIPARIRAMKTLGMSDEEIEAKFQEWKLLFHFGDQVK